MAKKIKVSQSTIDDIKRLGMTKALKLAGQNKGAEQSGAVAEFAEGVRRMYGETRYQNALYTPKASPGPVATKVSQSTINDIKKLGMTQALKIAKMNKSAEQSGKVKEFAEGVRRMYPKAK